MNALHTSLMHILFLLNMLLSETKYAGCLEEGFTDLDPGHTPHSHTQTYTNDAIIKPARHGRPRLVTREQPLLSDQGM
jgi:hypothetical protein